MANQISQPKLYKLQTINLFIHSRLGIIQEFFNPKTTETPKVPPGAQKRNLPGMKSPIWTPSGGICLSVSTFGQKS